MSESGFLSSAEIEGFLQFSSPEVQEIVMELRSLVVSACPGAAEQILWGGLSYHDPAKGGPVKGAICQIEVIQKQVQLSFIHGVRLGDPEALLSGDQLSKRSMAIASFDRAPWDAIQALIEEAAALDPASFDELPPP